LTKVLTSAAKIEKYYYKQLTRECQIKDDPRLCGFQVNTKNNKPRIDGVPHPKKIPKGLCQIIGNASTILAGNR